MSKKTFEVEVSDLDDFGRGVVHLENHAVFVDNLLPGEKATLETEYKYGKLASVKVLKRENDSPLRVTPPCPYYPSCGGCQIMHLSYKGQLDYKRDKVRNLLHKFAHLDIQVNDTLGMENPTRFRNKVQKPLRKDKKNHVITGFYKTNSHDLVSIKDCLSETEPSNKITNTLLSLFDKYRYPIYDEDKQTGLLRHILIKTSLLENTALVTLVVTNENLPGRLNFAKELIQRCPEVIGVVLNVNSRHTNVILGEKDVPVYGHTKIVDSIFDKKFLISSQSFYQTNPIQVQVLYKTAIDLAGLKKTDSIFDAYCGTGTIGLCASSYVSKVTGVEINKSAIKDAILNAKMNKVDNIRFYQGDATEFILKTQEHFDVIFLDPPRKGSTKAFIDAVKRIRPRTVVYISCDPVTLARDLALFKDTYEVKTVQPVDMFPNSLHVETVVLMSRIDK